MTKVYQYADLNNLYTNGAISSLTLEYHDFTRGRSSVSFVLKDTVSEELYRCSLTSFDAILKNNALGNSMTYKVVKRGTFHSICLI